jgi:hypothetical protein
MTTEETLPAPRRGGNWHQYLSETRVRCMRRAVLGPTAAEDGRCATGNFGYPYPTPGESAGLRAPLRSVARFIPSTKGRARFLV